MNYLQKLISKENLSLAEAREFMLSVMRGEVSEITLASFLTALRMKEETQEELAGFVLAVRESAIPRGKDFSFDFIDTCGTGGDEKGSINISTLTALTLASMGIPVAKHGNRSVTSVCGSSDLLEGLGYPFPKDPAEAVKRFEEDKFVFLFAPFWHPAMKYAANVRKTLGFRTVFNMIGPLSNPFSPTHQVIGVYSSEILNKVAGVLKYLHLKRAIVCHSRDGYDEFSIFAETEYCLLENGSTSYHVFSPRAFLPNFSENEISTRTKEESLQKANSVLAGELKAGTYAVALNSGVALYVFGKASSIEEGYHLSLEHLRTGAVQNFFNKLLSNFS